MNLLAHAYLTPSLNDDLLVGNLTADWIKGKARAQLFKLHHGFELHRRIDGFTDIHPATIAAVDALDANWGRYSPILIDVFLDYILASQWTEYSAEPFPKFVKHVYTVLQRHLHELPENVQYASHMLIADDWFTAYSTLDGIRLTLTRMSTRLQARGHLIELAPAVNDLLAMRSELTALLFTLFTDYQKLYQPPRAA